MEKKRTLFYFRNHFNTFYEQQSQAVQDKIDWTLVLIETLDFIPEKYLKHLTGTDGIYEIRAQKGNNAFRIFCFFDKGNIVVLCNGFQKKTQKTPQVEIDRAVKIKKDYENKITHQS